MPGTVLKLKNANRTNYPLAQRAQFYGERQMSSFQIGRKLSKQKLVSHLIKEKAGYAALGVSASELSRTGQIMCGLLFEVMKFCFLGFFYAMGNI